MIELTNLTKAYGGKLAVDDLSVTVRPGRVTGFLGPNGAGKSTTLRMILGLNAPSAGTVTVDGVPFATHPRGLRHAGALLDAGDVQGGRTARGHLRVLAASNRIPRDRVEEVLDLAGIGAAAGRRISGFSLGMRQRLGIAAALLGDPPVLLFDEPFNGLDPEGVLWVRELFKSLAAEGRTVFVSSHLMSEMENTAEHLVVIGRGRLIADESLAAFAGRGDGGHVRVRTPEAERLATLLTGAGGGVEAAGETLTVTGLSGDRVGELAFEHRVLLRELSTHKASLEAAFMELTADSVEYKAGAKR
ncbi:ABC transporter ATP-binding protein [Actinorhabdospora filicis]|uniref:ABC transporter ATP-binding protein n=1 Tax=Actinorhabdospora filicis TaxID=1785913 RepID=A0A9W6WCN4_9ACTN|nr:ATP-binding cassette domain-containing protein [Actinorhabdospora filicis]GLZ79970.1 ABC transporter ATP-binding protein [Actinorhabdospora filicis]